MTRYVNQELTLTDILRRSLRLHHLTLKYTISCILLITAVKYLSVFFIDLFPNKYAQVAIYLVATAVIVYLFSVALLMAHRAFLDQKKPILDAIKTVWQHIRQIYLTFIAYVAGIVATYHLSNLLIFSVEHLIHEPSSIHSLTQIIALILTLLFIVLFYFGLPIAVLDEKPIQKAFYSAGLLSEKQKLGVFTSIIMLGAIILLLTPGMINEYFLSMYHLDIVFDFIVLSVGMPLYLNSLLLIIHNAKRQITLED